MSVLYAVLNVLYYLVAYWLGAMIVLTFAGCAWFLFDAMRNDFLDARAQWREWHV